MLKRRQIVLYTQCRKEAFPVMSEWRVPNIMAQCDCLYQVFIKAQETANCSGYAGDKLDMEDSMGYVIVIDEAKYLSLVDISHIGTGVKDAISVQGKLLAVSSFFFRISPYA